MLFYMSNKGQVYFFRAHTHTQIAKTVQLHTVRGKTSKVYKLDVDIEKIHLIEKRRDIGRNKCERV